MNEKEILITGKLFFWSSFLMGNINLFGYVMTKNEDFAVYGFLLLIFGSVINVLVIICLLIYGFLNKSKWNICLKSSAIICINIPIAILYFFIGLSLLNL